MFEGLLYNIIIAFESIAQNKTRALLTSLGIVFGVSSVIAMLAIGKGASQEIVEKLKILGTNNIIITGLDKKEFKKSQDVANIENEEEGSNSPTQKQKFSPGLAIQDGEIILKTLPNVTRFSYETVIDLNVRNNRSMKQASLVGIDPNYFDINSITTVSGRKFADLDHVRGNRVCILGSNLAKRLFPTEKPLGKKVKCGKIWLEVIGIASQKSASGSIKNLPGIRNVNQDIYTPYNTLKIYFVRRDVVNSSDLRRDRRRGEESPSTKKEKFSQIDKLIIEINDTEQMVSSSPILRKLLLRLHNNKEDFKIIVPELLLEQEKSTKQIFNIVLSVIASISLIVGGIGIMNIMFSSVMERTKEIGIRRAVGAKQGDIRQQFIIEAVAISLSGGIIGIFFGLAMSFTIEQITEIKTIVSLDSVLISFFVSIGVGLIFGITPANKAAEQDPITLLRYE
ncbi:ABC transporter permease [Candidatus Kapabacteria bacterium]|nr:ABC transporter permease [Candidatus Kapabacteria bacterium]